MKLSEKQKPAVFLIALGLLMRLVVACRRPPAFGLVSAEGVVERAGIEPREKYGPLFHLDLRTERGTLHLKHAQWDSGSRSLGTVSPGDRVTAWSTRGHLPNRDTNWLWQLKHGEEFVFTRLQVREETERLHSILRPVTGVALLSGVLLLWFRRFA